MRYILTLLLLFMLSACQGFPSTDEASLAAIFSDMRIDTERIFINRVDEWTDLIESIDASDKDAIIIHIINHAAGMDTMICITPDWIYNTETMKKTPNTFDVATEAGYIALMETYTQLFDKDMLENETLLALAISLQDPKFHRAANGLMLRGLDPSVPTEEDTNAMVDIRYLNKDLLEVHFRLEHDFPSTKQTSNFISGIHWIFGAALESEFPPLEDFTQAP